MMKMILTKLGGLLQLLLNQDWINGKWTKPSPEV
ncbi:hypothetical protein V6Z12_A03G025200 [Gossypium hirsutum]